MSAEIRKRLFTVDECLRMEEAGILHPNERVELIQGEIFKMSPSGPRHGAAVDGTAKAAVLLTGDLAIVRVQGTVVLDQFFAPMPDLTLLRPRDDFYVESNPGPGDILLIIEIADSSLEYDMNVKASLYAIIGIQEYWIADLQNNRVMCYSERIAGKDYYGTIHEFRRGDVIAPQLLPDCRLKVDLLLP